MLSVGGGGIRVGVALAWLGYTLRANAAPKPPGW